MGFFEFGEAHVVVRGVGGEHDERFDAAEAGGRAKRRTLSQNLRAAERPPFRSKASIEPKPRIWRCGKPVIGMRCEAGIVDARDLGMLFQIFRDGDGVFALALYADGERLDAAAEKEGGFGVHEPPR